MIGHWITYCVICNIGSVIGGLLIFTISKTNDFQIVDFLTTARLLTSYIFLQLKIYSSVFLNDKSDLNSSITLRHRIVHRHIKVPNYLIDIKPILFSFAHFSATESVYPLITFKVGNGNIHSATDE